MDGRVDSTREITYIGLGIAALIGGGFMILQLSMVFPLPGVKYMLMAPYLSMVMYILFTIINSRYGVLKISAVFGGIMSFISLFMGMAILLTGVLTQISVLLLNKNTHRWTMGAALFSGYTGLTALLIPKYLMGGVFAEITATWLLLTVVICTSFGFLGSVLAKRIQVRVKNSVPNLKYK